VDAWCTPKKIRSSHFADQLMSIEGDSRAPTGFGLNDLQCVAPSRPRHKHPEQPIDRAKTQAPRPATFEHCQLMLRCNALPNQYASGTTIRAGIFNGVTVESQPLGRITSSRRDSSAFRVGRSFEEGHVPRDGRYFCALQARARNCQLQSPRTAILSPRPIFAPFTLNKVVP
jgi:hypothetical protein